MKIYSNHMIIGIKDLLSGMINNNIPVMLKAKDKSRMSPKTALNCPRKIFIGVKSTLIMRDNSRK